MKQLTTAGAVVLGLLGSAAQAEEKTMNAIAAWLGAGEAYKVGPERAYFTGKFAGAMFVQTEGSDALNAADLSCPGTVEISLGDGSQTGSGHCIITPAGGDVIYADWSCEGVHLVGCAGEFSLAGGTGRFEGITGAGPFVIRSALRGVVIDALEASVTEQAIGIAVWTDFKYTIPAE